MSVVPSGKPLAAVINLDGHNYLLSAPSIGDIKSQEKFEELVSRIRVALRDKSYAVLPPGATIRAL